jgi:HD-like signal output (HDOD) protein
MFSGFWRRLTGARANESAPVTTSAEPVARQAVAAATPADAPPANPLHVAEAALRRSLDWRARVLLEGASKEAQASDGPRLVQALRLANDSVIRQPPTAAHHALLLARHAETPIDQLVALFENDPALAQALLRQANSAFYRGEGGPCTSLHSGVQRIGSKGVQSVLMASLVHQTLCRPGSAYVSLVEKVWSHMQRTAPLARGIAPAFGVDPETAFSLALLHDVGKLVVFDHVSRIRHDRHRELQMPDVFFRQLLWHLHEPLGGLAVLRWDLGAEAARAIGEHHRRPAPEKPDRVTECLFVAEAIELARTNYAKLELDTIWQHGAITTDVASVEERLNAMEN